MSELANDSEAKIMGTSSSSLSFAHKSRINENREMKFWWKFFMKSLIEFYKILALGIIFQWKNIISQKFIWEEKKI